MIKKAINEYGDFVLEAVIVTVLLLLIFVLLPAGNGTFGIGNVLGSQVESDGIDYTTYADSSVTSSVLGRTKPQIEYNPYNAAGVKTRIIVGKDVALTSYFKCTDAEGSDVTNIKICSIKDKTGTELLTDKLGSTDTFRFASTGIYTVEVIATDSQNQYSIKKFSVPVSGTNQEV